jgi:hypothetical protein
MTGIRFQFGLCEQHRCRTNGTDNHSSRLQVLRQRPQSGRDNPAVGRMLVPFNVMAEFLIASVQGTEIRTAAARQVWRIYDYTVWVTCE